MSFMSPDKYYFTDTGELRQVENKLAKAFRAQSFWSNLLHPRGERPKPVRALRVNMDQRAPTPINTTA